MSLSLGAAASSRQSAAHVTESSGERGPYRIRVLGPTAWPKRQGWGIGRLSEITYCGQRVDVSRIPTLWARPPIHVNVKKLNTAGMLAVSTVPGPEESAPGASLSQRCWAIIIETELNKPGYLSLQDLPESILSQVLSQPVVVPMQGQGVVAKWLSTANALGLAASSGNSKALQTMLSLMKESNKQAALDYQDISTGRRVFHYAVEGGDLNCVELMLQHQAPYENDSFDKKPDAWLKHMHWNQWDCYSTELSPTIARPLGGDKGLYVEIGPARDDGRYRSGRYACFLDALNTPKSEEFKKHRLAMMIKLFSHGKIEHEVMVSELFKAVTQRGLEDVKRLIESGVDVNAKLTGHTALHKAAASDDLESIGKLLIQSGADVNALTDLGSTALLLAIVSENLDMARQLLLYGAESPPQHALDEASPEMKKLLASAAQVAPLTLLCLRTIYKGKMDTSVLPPMFPLEADEDAFFIRSLF